LALKSVKILVHSKCESSLKDLEIKNIMKIQLILTFIIGSLLSGTSVTALPINDSFGYIADTTGFSLRNVSNTGTLLFLDDEGGSSSIGIPFDFNFYGQDVSEIFVSANGFIYMDAYGASGCCDGGQIPSNDSINNIIAGWWSDLIVGPSGKIAYEVTGTAPARELVVGFYDVHYYDGSPTNSKVKFEIILHENSQNIELQYGNGPNQFPVDSITTIGIENSDGTIGLQIENQMGIPYSNEGILITHPCPVKLEGDLNFDCKYDLIDFALRAQSWLTDCITTPANELCIPASGINVILHPGADMGFALGVQFTPTNLVDSLLIEVLDEWLTEEHYSLYIWIYGINGGFELHGTDTIAVTDTIVFFTDGEVAHTIVNWTTDTTQMSVNEIYTVCVTILLKGEMVGSEKCIEFGPF